MGFTTTRLLALAAAAVMTLGLVGCADYRAGAKNYSNTEEGHYYDPHGRYEGAGAYHTGPVGSINNETYGTDATSDMGSDNPATGGSAAPPTNLGVDRPLGE